MHCKTLLAASSLLAASQVVGAPAPQDNNLSPRQDDWDYIDDDDGNTRIRVSDNSINFGAIGTDDVVQTIKDECTDVSCGSGGKDIEVETKIISEEGWVQVDRKITVHADGSFASESPGTRNDLVDMAERVLEEFVESELKDYTDVWSCRGQRCEGRFSPTHASPYYSVLTDILSDLAKGDTRYSHEATEYWWPDEIHIRVDDDNGVGTLDITFDVESTSDHSGLCDDLTSIGGAVASAVKAPTANLFSLFALGCS